MKPTQTLKNVELMWAFLAQPQTKGEFASNKYQVDVVLDGENLKLIEDLKSKKQQIKEKDGIKTFTLKSSVKPRVYDATGRLMTDDEVAKIGNGSVAMVNITQFTTPKYGTFVGLSAVKIKKMNTYTGGDVFGDEDEEVFDEGLI
mgnify:CR=1 FL=1